MNFFRLTALAAALFMAVCPPTYAQWQTPIHSVPVGRGAGVTGFGNATGASGQVLFGNTGADPAFRAPSFADLTGTIAPAQLNGAFPPLTASVFSITALKALTPGQYPYVYVQGYYGAASSGGGTFFWNSASNATDDGGSIIQAGAGGTGRWVRIIVGASVSYTPEMFGAQQTPGTTDDAAPIRAALAALNALGRGQLRPGSVVYNICSAGAGGGMINNYPNVDIVGNGSSTVLKLCNGMNVTLGTIPHMIIPSTQNIAQAINNVVYRGFVIDMNGANNSCAGACFNSNETLGAFYGDNILVDNVTLLNNPGSQGFSFGSTFAAFPTISDVRIVNSNVENMCDSPGGNASCTDSSAIWIHALNGVVANNTIQNCGATKGTGIELHGFNVQAAGNSIWTCGVGIILSSDTGAVATNSNGLSAVGNTINIVRTGVSVQVTTLTGSTVYNVTGNAIQLTGAAGDGGGIDASSVISTTGVTGTLNITGNIINGAVVTTLPNANAAPGIAVQYWSAVNIGNNILTNIGGPGIYFPGGTIAATSIYSVNGNILQDVGRVTSGGTLASGILFVAGSNSAGAINVSNNTMKNTSTVYATTGVNGSMNSIAALIYGNIASNITTNVNWTGSGASIGSSCAGVTAGTVTSAGGIVTHC